MNNPSHSPARITVKADKNMNWHWIAWNSSEDFLCTSFPKDLWESGILEYWAAQEKNQLCRWFVNSCPFKWSKRKTHESCHSTTRNSAQFVKPKQWLSSNFSIGEDHRFTEWNGRLCNQKNQNKKSDGIRGLKIYCIEKNKADEKEKIIIAVLSNK